MGPLGKIAAFFSSNTSLHSSSNNNNNNKELKKAANAAQQAIKRRNRRNEWYYGEAGVPRRASMSTTPMGGSTEDVHRSKFSRKNPMWSSLRDLRSSRRPPPPPELEPPPCRPPPEQVPPPVRPPPDTDHVPVRTSPEKVPPSLKSVLEQVPPPAESPPPELVPPLEEEQVPFESSPGYVPPPVRSTPEQVPPSVRPTPEQVPPSVRPTSEQVPPSVRSTPEQVPPSVRPTPEQVPPSVRPTPEQVPPSVRPTPEQVPPSVRPTPEQVPPSEGCASPEPVSAELPHGLQDPKQHRPTSAQEQDHNGRLQLEPAKGQNGVSAPLPARRALGSARASPSPPAAPRAPSPREVALEVHKRLLPDLRHNAAAFEAMAVLLDYTTSKLGAFAAPALRRDLEKLKSDMVCTVKQLEESRAECRRREEQQQRAQEELEASRRHGEDQEKAVSELRQRLSGHEEEVKTMRAHHEGEVAALRQQLDSHADSVTRGLREEYELELDRVTRRHEETLRAALGAARVEAERDAAQRAQEAARREAEVLAQLQAKESAHEALKEQSRRVMDSMKSDKDSRNQALAARCRELQDEVDSLRSVLELRCTELQKSRRENDRLRIAADALPGAEQRISTLTARLEDLQVQLDRKGMLESKLVMENSELQQSFSKEIKEKQMLSLQNEQLQFKLKQNTEVVNALAANMSDFHDVSAILNASLSNGINISSQDKCRRNSKGGKTSPPESPKVKGVVEKSESVSYMLEMETDTTDDMVARFYRRVASTPVSSPAHSARHSAGKQRTCCTPMTPLAQSSSATAIPSSGQGQRPTPKQRSTASRPRPRSRSISSDSGECLSSGNWSPPASLPPHRTDGCVSQDAERSQSVNDHHPATLALPLPLRQRYDCSDIEDFSSSKSSSMSCSSEGSELGVKEAEAVEPSCFPQGALPDQPEHPQDLMTTSCGSNSELLIGKQTTLPKDAGGEAMISEEMTEEDANGLNSSCDGSSEDESNISDRSGGDPVRAGAARTKPYLKLAISGSASACGQSAINTPMDSSWSEDMELPVSLSLSET